MKLKFLGCVSSSSTSRRQIIVLLPLLLVVIQQNFTMVVSSSSPTTSTSRSMLFSFSVEEEPKGWKLSSFIDSKQCPTSTTTTTTSDSTTTNTTDGIVSSFSHICDPDNILNNESIGDLRKMIEQDILNLENQVIPCKNMKNLKDDNHADNDDNDIDVHVQIAVVIIEKMDLTDHSFMSRTLSSLDEAAQEYAVSIHNSWGVGNLACEGTGILLFVSTLDRVLYISTSTGVGKYLTYNRLENIIQHSIKPEFKQNQYAYGISQGIQMMQYYLESGEPSFFEHYSSTMFSWGMFGSIFAYLLYQQRKKDREHAEIRKKLTKLDEEKARALAGKYECTSCPICLEDFKVVVEDKDQNNDRRTEHDNLLLNNYGGNEDNNNPTTKAPPSYIGSDGKPVRILKCGHSFDESCWVDWIKRGSNVRQCPICKQDVCGSPTPTRRDRSNTTLTTVTTTESQDVYQVYTYERNFRLQRLRYRYPGIIDSYQIRQWTDSNYSSRMAQDFDVRQRTSSSHHRSGNSSFGGGYSGGGAGGHW